MDAFGLLYNEIVGMTIHSPNNYRVSNAPVSYPPLWNVPTYDWFQWNCCVNNPMVRNVIEVLGAFGRQSVSGSGDKVVFDSSVRLEPLQKMWEWMETLRPPQWPGNVFGEIDQARVARGRDIYLRENCQSCHFAQPPWPQTEPNSYGRRFVRLKMVPWQEVGTDPLMAQNFQQRSAETGLMKPILGGKDVVAAFDLFAAIGGGVMAAKFQQERVTPELQEQYFQQRDMQVPDAAQLHCYKAEPLTGIWATSPYLHNGSVPNLYELLLPPEQRSKSFYVGNPEFDPRHVGLQSAETPGAFQFDTTLPGNSNSGHAYGTGMTDAERWDLIEYLKSL
jgi:hypothetical protein